MSVPGSHTNVAIPGRRKEWLSRKRLLDLLARLTELKLVLVAAPPGYGKTSLLVDFASQQDLPVCWLQLDPLDLDPRRFLFQFIAAIRRQYPAFGEESLAAVLGNPAGLLDREVIATLLANEVSSSIPEHFIFILDDLQCIEESDEIIAILNGYIERVGENCHLILSSRSLPSLPCLPKMAASMQVGGISFEELSFQPDEIQTLFLLNGGVHIPFSEAEELAAESEGWITGIILSLQTTPIGGADQLRLARVSGIGLYEYLAQQVLDIQAPEIRSFLLRSAFLGEFDPALCEQVFGPEEDWATLISETLRSNLFILALGESPRWFRYNPLFQQFLQETLTREDPEAAHRLLRKLGEVYKAQKNWEKAYGVYRRLNDPESLANLILAASPSLASDGQLITLSTWLDALPAKFIRDQGSLASLRGIVGVMLGEVDSGCQLLDRAIELFRQGDEPISLATGLTRRSLGRIFRADFRGALSDAVEAEQLSVLIGDLPFTEAEALRSKGLSLINLDRGLEARGNLEKALLLYTSLEDFDKVALTQIDLGYLNSILGLNTEALGHYERSLAHWEAKKNLVHQATLLNNIGVILHTQGDILGASKRFEEALQKARRCGYLRAETLTLASIGDLYGDIDDLEAALSAYQEAKETALQGELRSFLFYIELAEVIITYRRGDTYLAFELLAIAERKVSDSESVYERALFGLRAGFIYLLNQDFPEAVTALADAAQLFLSSGRRLELAQVTLLIAQAYYSLDDEDRGFKYLEQAIQTAAGLDGEWPFVGIGRFAEGVLNAPGLNSSLSAAAKRLQMKITDFENSIGHTRRALRRQENVLPVSPPLLSIRSLGEMQVVLGGRLVGHRDWHSQVAQDLFYCLLAYPEGLTKERIAAMFWPDSPPQQVRTNFKNALYRLRLTLGSAIVVFEAGRYRFNTLIDYWYDAKEFLEILSNDNPNDDPAGTHYSFAKSRFALRRAISAPGRSCLGRGRTRPPPASFFYSEPYVGGTSTGDRGL